MMRPTRVPLESVSAGPATPSEPPLPFAVDVNALVPDRRDEPAPQQTQSGSTAEDWRAARAWLRKELRASPSEH